MSEIYKLEYFYLFGAFQGVVLVILLLAKARSKANYILVGLITLLSFYLLEQVLYLNGDISNYPHFLFVTLPIIFLIGPTVYHFVRLSINPDQGWKWIHLGHLAPFIYELAILIPFYSLPSETKLAVYKYSIQSQETITFDQFSLGFLLYVVSTVYFLILGFRLLRNAHPQKKRGNGKKKLLMYIISATTVYLALNLILFIIGFFLPNFMREVQLISPLLMSLLIHTMGFICYLNPDLIVSGESKPKYENSSLTNQDLESLAQSLNSVLRNKNLYLKYELKPQELSDKLGISTTNLSRVISEGLNTNFYNLVNEHRVNRAKDLLVSNEYSDAKLLHIALDSGFTNKSTFVRNFKRFTGMTPSDYRKKGFTKVSETP